MTDHAQGGGAKDLAGLDVAADLLERNQPVEHSVIPSSAVTDELHESKGIHCAICDGPLWESHTPDERTAALWLRGLCRLCGDQLDVGVCVSEDGSVEDLLDTRVLQQ